MVRLGLSIAMVDPPNGSPETLVTIAGAGFEPGATTITFNGTAAIVRTVSGTAITTTVPTGATSGLLTVTTSRGSVSRPFEVPPRRDFTLVAEPGTVPAVSCTTVSVAIRVSTSELNDVIELVAGSLPAGVTAVVSPPVATALTPSVLTLTVSDTVPAGSSPVEIRATARIDGLTVTQTASVMLAVQPPGQTVLIGQVRDRGERPLGGVRIVLGSATLTALGESDAGGNFFVPLPVSGEQVLLLDGSALNTATAYWPTVPLTVTITPGVVNTLGFVPRLEPMPAAKLVPIVAGQDTVLTAPELPGSR